MAHSGLIPRRRAAKLLTLLRRRRLLVACCSSLRGLGKSNGAVRLRSEPPALLRGSATRSTSSGCGGWWPSLASLAHGCGAWSLGKAALSCTLSCTVPPPPSPHGRRGSIRSVVVWTRAAALATLATLSPIRFAGLHIRGGCPSCARSGGCLAQRCC